MKSQIGASKVWAGTVSSVAKQSMKGYFEDNALSRGGAIAYFTLFSIAPVLLLIIAIAGLVFGPRAARGALVTQLQGTMGRRAAETIQTMLASNASRGGGILATIGGFVMLLVSASGVFAEVQSALNAIWRVKPHGTTLGKLIRTRVTGLAMIAALAALLMLSLAASTALGFVGYWLEGTLPYLTLIMRILDLVVSLATITALFAAVNKVLPDTAVSWRASFVGGFATALLFTVGKTLIGLYIGSRHVASGYGAAGALVIIILWIYYSAQIFLFGAEFTKAYAAHRESLSGG